MRWLCACLVLPGSCRALACSARIQVPLPWRPLFLLQHPAFFIPLLRASITSICSVCSGVCTCSASAWSKSSVSGCVNLARHAVPASAQWAVCACGSAIATTFPAPLRLPFRPSPDHGPCAVPPSIEPRHEPHRALRPRLVPAHSACQEFTSGCASLDLRSSHHDANLPLRSHIGSDLLKAR